MSKTVLPSGPQGTNRMQVEKHDGSRWNKTNTQEIKISLYSPARPTTTTGQTPRCCHADRVTPARAAPPRTCGARAAGTGNTPPALCDVGGRCLALGVCFCTGRWFPFFITKNSQVGFFNNTPIFFSFFVGFGSSRGAWAGIGCVWAHPLFRSRENLCQRSDFISKFFTVHSTGPKCIGSIGDRRGRGREAKSGRPGAFSPGAPLISSLAIVHWGVSPLGLAPAAPLSGILGQALLYRS